MVDRVGYKNPSKDCYFKPGNCANPYGRAGRKKTSLLDIVKEVDNAMVAYKENGNSKKDRRNALTVKQFRRKAAAGDVDAADMLIEMRLRSKDIDVPAPITIWMTEEELKACR